MIVEQIQIRQQQAAVKFELAAQIRKWLDHAKCDGRGTKTGTTSKGRSSNWSPKTPNSRQ
ncbi:MAG TPA: hypothetical protein VL132_02580 [Planctomycetaceae bacterium]|jgi:hypothetical protein|nr:hypothetical protein [Planctomycetaceae bacterium]